jgi:predicted NUDIX family NTP pyrophosphohydrolase
MQAFPEADRAIWFEPHEAARNIIKGQAPIVASSLVRLGRPGSAPLPNGGGIDLEI